MAATACRRGPSAPPTRRPRPSSRSAPACARTSSSSYPSLDPARVHVVHNGIDSQLWSADRSAGGHRDRPAARRRPRQAVRRLRRSDHPPEGPALPAARLRGAAARRPARALRRRPRHAGDPRRGRGPDERPAGSARGRRLDPRHAAARRGRRPAEPRHRLRLPVRLRAARHRQPRGDGVRARRRRHRDRRHPRGRRRRRDRLARADRAGAGRHRHARWTPTASSPTSRQRWPTRCPTSTGPAPSVVAGRTRAVDSFSWASIGDRTLEVYRAVLGS